MNNIMQYVFFIIILIVLAIPLGQYIKKVMNGEQVFLTKLLLPGEKIFYKLLGINSTESMTGKEYFKSVLWFSVLSFMVLFVMGCLQNNLPFNPQHMRNLNWDLSFNTAVSFITNTNWQAYNGELQLSYLVQFMGLTTQNFVSPAAGIAVLFAFIRGFVKKSSDGIGNFWVDIIRSILYILLPLSFVFAVVLSSQGVIQNFRPGETVRLLEPVAADSNGNILKNAVINEKTGLVYVNGKIIDDAEIIEQEFVPMGPGASQIAIKQLGTNGGGFMGTNSAHPLENPNTMTNILEIIAILLIPAALCFSLGYFVKDVRQGRSVFMAMLLMLLIFLCVIAVNEQNATPQLAQNGAVDIAATNAQAGGNMEGKEARFGIAGSTIWTSFTTAASNGSVNSMLDSYTPLGGLVAMLQMQLGEVIFGGVGSGLYGMMAFIILTVFIAGLMVGRTPEYLGKKIEPYEMKWAVFICLATPIAILIFSGIAACVPEVINSLNNHGPHGLSEILYTYSSTGANNGSAFAGFNANIPFVNITTGICMLFARFLPIAGALAIADNLIKKKKIAVTAGTLSTSNAMFVFLLIFVVLLIGALSFLPALSLGPIAEYIKMVS